MIAASLASVTHYCPGMLMEIRIELAGHINRGHMVLAQRNHNILRKLKYISESNSKVREHIHIYSVHRHALHVALATINTIDCGCLDTVCQW